MDLTNALALTDQELVAFVGAGGKKTAMARLAEEARHRDLAIGYTTTTHTPPPAALPLVLEPAETLSAALADAEPSTAFAAETVENPQRAAEKVRGYDPETIDDLSATNRFDWLLVKADGARRREFKAPGPDEPVVPARATHVVVVASVQAVGKPLDAATAHRPKRVAALTDTAVGDPITPETVGQVLAHEDGGLKGVPTNAQVTALLNKADTPALREQAHAALDAAFSRSSRLERGLITSFETGHCETVEREADTGP